MASRSTQRVQYRSMLSAVARHNAQFPKRERLTRKEKAALAAANREFEGLMPEFEAPETPFSEAA